MAKSIFEILDTLSTETSVPVVGKNVEHTLPRKLFPTAEIFEAGKNCRNGAIRMVTPMLYFRPDCRKVLLIAEPLLSPAKKMLLGPLKWDKSRLIL